MPDQAKFPQGKLLCFSPFPLVRSQFVSRNKTKREKENWEKENKGLLRIEGGISHLGTAAVLRWATHLPAAKRSR